MRQIFMAVTLANLATCLVVALFFNFTGQAEQTQALVAQAARDERVQACIERVGGIPSRQAECWTLN